MSDVGSAENSVVNQAVARIPPWPPCEPARGDDGSRSHTVLFYEHLESSGEAEPDRRLALVTFDPRRNRDTHETLSPRGLPRLFANLCYKAETSALMVMVLREGRELITLSVAVRLSDASSLSILVHRNCKV